MGQEEEWGLKYLSYREISDIVDDLHKEYKINTNPPIDIEKFVDNDLGIDIVPIHGLKSAFEIDGFLTRDLKEINVDDLVSEMWPSRYRFTLSHELGHRFLHNRLLLEKAQYSNSSGWIQFVNSMPEEIRKWFEFQAYAFGGIFLVPKDKLAIEARKRVDFVKKNGPINGLNCDYAWDRIESSLADIFHVSLSTIQKRINKDGIKDRFPLI